ncbi:hypothetical protein [Pseudactinotalea sp. Z1732]|uniref:hypothetical protein n=1 Tax=Micrococcales TaxID=85006 RepID=UPI003C7E10AF
MGIYPRTKIVDRQRNIAGGEFWTEEEHTPGLIRRRLVVAQPWVEERTDCFCCSCDNTEYGTRVGSDPHCRNHGFAAERPCETHNMPGQTNEDGVMPASVQKARAS